MTSIGQLVQDDSFISRLRDVTTTMDFVHAGPGAGRTFPNLTRNDQRADRGVFPYSGFGQMLAKQQNAFEQTNANAQTTTGTFINRENYPSKGQYTNYHEMAGSRAYGESSSPPSIFGDARSKAGTVPNMGGDMRGFMPSIHSVPLYYWLIGGALLYFLVLRRRT
jgi:hypothetical protein